MQKVFSSFRKSICQNLFDDIHVSNSNKPFLENDKQCSYSIL